LREREKDKEREGWRIMPLRMRRPRRQAKGQSGEGNRDQNRVQKLYDACRDAFLTPATSSKALLQLKGTLDSIKPEDVGLAEESSVFQSEDLVAILDNHSSELPPVFYFGIDECKEFTVGIFCLLESGVIPLHDHPGMTVLSKLLYGSMHVRAYDWIEPRSDADPTQPRLAKLVKDEVILAPCEISILYPTHGGNIHTFVAITPCAILDVLSPSYSEEEGRDCTYYRDTPIHSLPGESLIHYFY
jgi:cysteamine dioxygenase